MNNIDFVGARLELARTFAGLTLSDLAAKVLLSVGVLSHYENGLRKPSMDLVSALAVVLKVKPDFFFEPLSDVWREEECHFRRRIGTPEGMKKRARAHGTFMGLVLKALRSVARFPNYNIPKIDTNNFEEIELAAERCRDHWQLGQGPIRHIGRVAERNGIVLLQHFQHTEKIDAFSRKGEISMIVLNSARTSTSRWIFDIAHELAHFVIHDGRETGAKEIENQADYFASAFLMPRTVFSREFRAKPFSWTHIFELKRRWIVSAQAIVRRAFNLSILDGLMYRRIYKQMQVRGWVKQEPQEPEFIGPELMSSAMEILKKTGVSLLEFSSQLNMTPEFFSEITGITLPVVSRFKPTLVSA